MSRLPSDLRLILGGIKSLAPSRRPFTGTGGTIDARYCYAVWMRHLLMIEKAGLDPKRASIVEFGPGDSIGTGLAALLTTAERYTALDVVPHAAEVVQVRLFDAIVDMLHNRDPIAGPSEFPKLFPRLDCYDFPAELLTDPIMDRSLAADRLDRLRAAIGQMTSAGDGQPIRYICPWSTGSVRPHSVDLVFSQAALQEVDNPGNKGPLFELFRAMALWLKPGGIMSHQIDLGMYGATPWDRQWTYTDEVWALIKGRRVNYINREPLSNYEALCRQFGFDVALLEVEQVDPVTPTAALAPRFRTLSDRDRKARCVHLVAMKHA